ncbi:MAG TPA: hypothetical protein VGI81_05105, partial [Tepidisphaeraceae bacterium]
PAWVTGDWRCIANDPVAGRYHFTLHLRRRFQLVTGTARIGRSQIPIANGRLFGNRLTFTLIDWHQGGATKWFSAHIEGHQIRGTSHADATGAGPMVEWGGICAAGAN